MSDRSGRPPSNIPRSQREPGYPSGADLYSEQRPPPEQGGVRRLPGGRRKDCLSRYRRRGRPRSTFAPHRFYKPTGFSSPKLPRGQPRGRFAGAVVIKQADRLLRARQDGVGNSTRRAKHANSSVGISLILFLAFCSRGGVDKGTEGQTRAHRSTSAKIKILKGNQDTRDTTWFNNPSDKEDHHGRH